jgi:hypothetical protein
VAGAPSVSAGNQKVMGNRLAERIAERKDQRNRRDHQLRKHPSSELGAVREGADRP